MVFKRSLVLLGSNLILLSQLLFSEIHFGIISAVKKQVEQLKQKKYSSSDVLPAQNTTILSDETDNNLVSISPDGWILYYNKNAKEISTLKSGDIIISTKDNGFLRKIVSITSTTDGYTVLTTQATLEEAFEKLDVSFSKIFTLEDIDSKQPPNFIEGVSLNKINPQEFVISISSTAILCDADKATTFDQVKIEGTLKFKLSGDFGLKIESSDLKEVNFLIRDELDSDIKLKLDIKEVLEKEKVFGRIFFRPILVAPLVFTPEVELIFGIKSQTDINANLKVKQLEDIKVGLEYNWGNWTKINNSTSNFQTQEILVLKDGDVKIYIKKKFKLKVYDIVSSCVEVNNYLTFESQLNNFWKLYGETEAKGGVEFTVISSKRSNYEAILFQHKTLLAQKQQTINLNHPPVILSLTAQPSSIAVGGSCRLICDASDPDGDILNFNWTATGGTISGSGSQVIWQAPLSVGSYTITCTVTDGKSGTAEATTNIIVVNSYVEDQPPIVVSLTATPPLVSTGGICVLTCKVIDPDNDVLSYKWNAQDGIIFGKGSQVGWKLPSSTGVYLVTCSVVDSKGKEAKVSTNVIVSLDVQNYPPMILSVKADPPYISLGGTTYISCTVVDPDNDPLEIGWSKTEGEFFMVGYISGASGSQSSSEITFYKGSGVYWRAPVVEGTYTITCAVIQNKVITAESSVDIFVVSGEVNYPLENYPPEILSLSGVPSYVSVGETILITCNAKDPENASLSYVWNATAGTISGSGSQISWTAPSSSGTYTIICIVSDDKGKAVMDFVRVNVISERKIWTRQWGNASENYGNCVAVDTQGDIYVVGYTYGYLVDESMNSRDMDVFLTKYDPLGNKLWTKQWGSYGKDAGFSVSVDSSCNVYVVGYTNDRLDGNTNQGRNDIFLIKCDPSGNKLWTKQWGSRENDRGMCVKLDNLGNVYIVGYTEGVIGSNQNLGGCDIILIKCDLSGNILWTKQWGSDSDDIGMRVDLDSSGNIYITGYTKGAIGSNLNVGGNDVFLTKCDSSGNILWTKQWGTVDEDIVNSIIIDKAGDIYLCGYVEKRSTVSINRSNTKDIFLNKYDSLGNLLWSKRWGPKDDVGSCVAIDSLGNIYLVGYTNGEIDGNLNFGGYDIFLTKFNPLGEKIWTKQWGTDQEDKVSWIAIDSLDNLYIVGTTKGNLDGNMNLGLFSTDVFLVKFK